MLSLAPNLRGALALFVTRLYQRDRDTHCDHGRRGRLRPVRQWARDWHDTILPKQSSARIYEPDFSLIPDRQSWGAALTFFDNAHDKYRGCELCGERRLFASRLRRDGAARCENCLSRRNKTAACPICARVCVPLEKHHVAGRAHGGDIVAICLNCHEILSETQKLHDPRLGFLRQGVLDLALLSLFPHDHVTTWWPACRVVAEYETARLVEYAA